MDITVSSKMRNVGYAFSIKNCKNTITLWN